MTAQPTALRCTATLNARDIAMFASIGVPIDLIEEGQIQRVTDRDARERFGILGPLSRNMAGIIFPYFSHVTGRRVTARVRRDNPEIKDGKPENKYISAYGDSRHLYFPPDARSKLQEPVTPIVLVEAEKSVLAITAWARRTSTDVIPVGMGGCWGWRGRVGRAEGGNGERVDVKGPLSDLAVCEGRTVYLMLDSNVVSNSKVQAARSALVKELRKRGCVVRLCNIPEVTDVNGPDDFIGACGDGAMAEVFAASTHADVGPAVIEPAARRGYLRMPHSVLQHGPKLGPYGLAVAVVLAHHANAEGECWPSIRRIMELSGIHGQATVSKSLKQLESLGIIQISKTKKGFITKHVYRFTAWSGECNGRRGDSAATVSPDALAPFHRVKPNDNQELEEQMGKNSLSSPLVSEVIDSSGFIEGEL